MVFLCMCFLLSLLCLLLTVFCSLILVYYTFTMNYTFISFFLSRKNPLTGTGFEKINTFERKEVGSVDTTLFENNEQISASAQVRDSLSPITFRSYELLIVRLRLQQVGFSEYRTGSTGPPDELTLSAP